MRKEIDKMKNALKGKSSRNLDGMIKRTDSPFTSEVLECLFPSKSRLPQLETYDRNTDLLEHIESFKTLMNLQRTPDEVMCRSFPKTLKGAARVWFSKLASSLIANFKQLSDFFVQHFIIGQRHKRPNSHLLTIK